MALAAPSRPEHRATGLLYALAAYLTWGLAPIYFKSLQAAGPLEIVAHRVVWSIVFLVALLALRGRLRPLLSARPTWRRAGLYAATTLTISCNWLLFIWAINSGHLLEASLGYFMNPLVNVLLAVIFLRESLNRPQLIAVLLAVIGVGYQVFLLGEVPVISLVLATTFAVYGLLRKKGRVDPIGGLLIETSLVAPIAGIYLGVLAAKGTGAFIAGGLSLSMLLPLAGAITALPLIWFQLGANRLRYTTIGLLQYVAPSCHFLLAVLIYGEAFTLGHAVTFGFIWSSLVLYTFDALRKQRRVAMTQPGVAARA